MTLRKILPLCLPLALAGCAPQVDADQGRMCRIILPVIIAPDETVHIVRTASDNDGTGIAVRYYTLGANGRSPGQSIHCQFEGGNSTAGATMIPTPG